MAPPNVDVTPDKPLHITDGYRDFGTVTIKPGGQIFVETTADITIKELVKDGLRIKRSNPPDWTGVRR